MDRHKVLLIDDEAGFTDLVKINLEMNGRYDVAVENDSMKAVDTARNFEPDVVVLDVVMPGKDGGDILSEFQREPRLSAVPIIMLTALMSNDETSGDAVKQSGGEVMLAKPVSTDTLVETIEARLAGQL